MARAKGPPLGAIAPTLSGDLSQALRNTIEGFGDLSCLGVIGVTGRFADGEGNVPH
jgi:hypothetical protein